VKDVLRNLVEPAKGNLLKTCLAREYLQARILQTMQDSGVFRNWAFVGGTALRFLYSIPRFSEDLDFSLISPEHDSGFADAMKRVESVFLKEAYAVRVAAKTEKTVASAFVKFEGLPYEIGVSAQRSQVFSIKIELETNPPAGAGLQTTLVRRHVTLNLVHYDKPSLLAGKMHALLTRKYTKGRDLYDLVWYLADRSWPPPNLVLLNAALAQTGWKDPVITSDNWGLLLRDRLEHFSWKAVRDDLLPFLERPQEADLITRENLLSLLENR
jgi:predicted nucleotidyltransferase component of viral defense system